MKHLTAVALLLLSVFVGPQLAAQGQSDLTPAAARRQVVRYEASPTLPGATHGLDANGRVVWSSSSNGTWGYRYNAAGRKVEMVDEHGNRTLFAVDPSTKAADCVRYLSMGPS